MSNTVQKIDLPHTEQRKNDASSLISIIERAASNPAVDVDKLFKLLEMRERVEAQESKKAYASALAEMQPSLPVIAERGKIEIGKGKPQSYALWEDVNEAIRPVISANGFALSFRVGQSEGKITVTGVLSHREGHSEETTITLPHDSSGSKNAVQAVGSSVSYGKRYTAFALLNITSRGEDDDGQKGDRPATINDDQLGELTALIASAGADTRKFCEFYRIEKLSDLPSFRLDEAMKALEQKGRRRG